MTEPSLLAFAALCNNAALALSDQLSALGPKPDDPTAAAAWSLSVQRLNGQINSLTRTAIEDSAAAVSGALASERDTLDRLQQAVDDAEERITAIQHAAALLTTVSRILDVGLALLKTAQDPANLPGLIGAIDALADDVGDSLPEG